MTAYATPSPPITPGGRDRLVRRRGQARCTVPLSSSVTVPAKPSGEGCACAPGRTCCS